MAIDRAVHVPPLRAPVVAQEIEDTVRSDRGIDDESAEIAHHPGLAEIAEEEISDETLLDGAEHHGLETQPWTEGRDHHQHAEQEDHDPPMPEGRYAGRRIVDKPAEHRR